MIEGTICESHFTPTDTLIIVPLAFEHLAIAVVACTLSVSPVIAIGALVIAPVLKHNLDSSIQRHCACLESAVENLILARV